MTTPDSDTEHADPAAERAAQRFVDELISRSAKEDPKRSTTIRIYDRTFRRIKAQEARWPTNMSEMIEEGLEPILTKLENTKSPKDSRHDD